MINNPLSLSLSLSLSSVLDFIELKKLLVCLVYATPVEISISMHFILFLENDMYY